MHEAVKEGYGGRGGLRRGDHSTGYRGLFYGALLDLQRGELSFGVGRISSRAPVCWGFWAQGPGYPYHILELGSCPSWQGG
jgi:hypothetical protein